MGMGLDEAREIEARFEHYVDGLASVIGHADRVGPFARFKVGRSRRRGGGR
jgi:hypothetical protein